MTGEQYLIQIAASDLDIGHRALAVEHLRWHADEFPAVPVDIGHAALVELVFADTGHEPHPLGHLVTGPAQVDRLAAGARLGGALDNSGSDARAQQLQREGVTRDAAAAHQDVAGVNCAHDRGQSAERMC